MIDRKALLADLRRQLKRLEQDLAERTENVPEMTSVLQEEYRAARDAERTGDTFLIWRTGALSQAAVAWPRHVPLRRETAQPRTTWLNRIWNCRGVSIGRSLPLPNWWILPISQCLTIQRSSST